MARELPCFRTARLILRPLAADHVEACIAMDDEPEVMRFIPARWHDAASHRACVEARVRRAWPKGMGYWAALASGEFLGWILLGPIDHALPEIEIGWRFRRRTWGQGYATEAAGAVLGHGFEALRLAEIVADTDPANRRSIRVAEKLGMRSKGPATHAGYPVIRFVARVVGQGDRAAPD